MWLHKTLVFVCVTSLSISLAENLDQPKHNHRQRHPKPAHPLSLKDGSEVNAEAVEAEKPGSLEDNYHMAAVSKEQGQSGGNPDGQQQQQTNSSTDETSTTAKQEEPVDSSTPTADKTMDVFNGGPADADRFFNDALIQNKMKEQAGGVKSNDGKILELLQNEIFQSEQKKKIGKVDETPRNLSGPVGQIVKSQEASLIPKGRIFSEQLRPNLVAPIQLFQSENMSSPGSNPPIKDEGAAINSISSDSSQLTRGNVLENVINNVVDQLQQTKSETLNEMIQQKQEENSQASTNYGQQTKEQKDYKKGYYKWNQPNWKEQSKPYPDQASETNGKKEYNDEREKEYQRQQSEKNADNKKIYYGSKDSYNKNYANWKKGSDERDKSSASWEEIKKKYGISKGEYLKRWREYRNSPKWDSLTPMTDKNLQQLDQSVAGLTQSASHMLTQKLGNGNPAWRENGKRVINWNIQNDGRQTIIVL